MKYGDVPAYSLEVIAISNFWFFGHSSQLLEEGVYLT